MFKVPALPTSTKCPCGGVWHDDTSDGTHGWTVDTNATTTTVYLHCTQKHKLIQRVCSRKTCKLEPDGIDQHIHRVTSESSVALEVLHFAQSMMERFRVYNRGPLRETLLDLHRYHSGVKDGHELEKKHWSDILRWGIYGFMVRQNIDYRKPCRLCPQKTVRYTTRLCPHIQEPYHDESTCSFIHVEGEVKETNVWAGNVACSDAKSLSLLNTRTFVKARHDTTTEAPVHTKRNPGSGTRCFLTGKLTTELNESLQRAKAFTRLQIGQSLTEAQKKIVVAGEMRLREGEVKDIIMLCPDSAHDFVRRALTSYAPGAADNAISVQKRNAANPACRSELVVLREFVLKKSQITDLVPASQVVPFTELLAQLEARTLSIHQLAHIVRDRDNMFTDMMFDLLQNSPRTSQGTLQPSSSMVGFLKSLLKRAATVRTKITTYTYIPPAPTDGIFELDPDEYNPTKNGRASNFSGLGVAFRSWVSFKQHKKQQEKYKHACNKPGWETGCGSKSQGCNQICCEHGVILSADLMVVKESEKGMCRTGLALGKRRNVYYYCYLYL